jgi:hypothetical protein
MEAQHELNGLKRKRDGRGGTVTDLLTRLPSHPTNQLDQLLPDKWKPSTN